jgi:allophanate hydrolase subunit 2
MAGDRLPLRQPLPTDRADCRLEGFDLRPPERLRAIRGPQDDHFRPREIAAFFRGEYAVGAGSDRVAMQLDGHKVRHAGSFDITSDAVAPGSIQVLGNGQPIVLMADRQTTGGYPKIATVISADLPALGRTPIGAKIAFEPVTVEAAQTLRRELIDAIDRIRDCVVPLDRDRWEIAPMLGACNLVSGVVDAQSRAM